MVLDDGFYGLEMADGLGYDGYGWLWLTRIVQEYVSKPVSRAETIPED